MSVDVKTILYMVAKEFGLNRNNTEDRLKLQKTIYLLQANGLRLGYGFSWYKYGPYSQDLVYDAHTVLGAERDRYEEDTSSLVFNENSRNRFARFKEICSGILDDVEKLELAASVDFVRRTWYPEATGDELARQLKQHKKQLYHRTWITDQMIGEAVGICDELRQN